MTQILLLEDEKDVMLLQALSFESYRREGQGMKFEMSIWAKAASDTITSLYECKASASWAASWCLHCKADHNVHTIIRIIHRCTEAGIETTDMNTDIESHTREPGNSDLNKNREAEMCVVHRAVLLGREHRRRKNDSHRSASGNRGTLLLLSNALAPVGQQHTKPKA